MASLNEKPLTGEPDAGNPPVRFGGRGEVSIPHPYLYPGKGFRRDCILANLPPEQRAKVNQWLFDKGLSYAQVAEACGRFLGVSVSKSSVARYYGRVMEGRILRGRVSEPVSQWVSECGKQQTWPGVYHRFVEGLMDAAWEAMERYEFALKHEGYTDLKEARWIVNLMRLIISARRAEHVRTLAMGERAELQWAAARAVAGMAKLTKGKEVRSPLTRVQRADSFVGLCARWDAERERELTGGTKWRAL